jgi:predicted amino acid racemase
MPEELIPLCEACLALPGVELHGIGASLSHISDIVPDEKNMALLAVSALKAERALGVRLPLVSSGSSSSIKMMTEGRLPDTLNHLRIGEAILLGNIVCYDIPYEGARTDAFTLSAEIIEAKDKPSQPWGERPPGFPPIELDPAFKDRGVRRRALIAIGKQDVSSQYLVPLDPGLLILGDTSDCMIADVTDCEKEYIPGNTVSFRLKYNGLVAAMASAYIDKKLV